MELVNTSMSREVPGSVRIRTDEGNEWRYDAVESAADYYDCNRSDAVAYACEDVSALVDAVEEVLRRDDLTQQQREEIAETLSSRGISFEVELDVETSTS
jgi:hypothetical protein